MNLLVTGGAGFIGCNFLQRVIAEGAVARLVCLDALTYAGHPANLRAVEGSPKFKFARIDLRDREAVVGLVQAEAITHVVHLAAESHVDRSISGPDAFIHTNVVGTFHLLEACRKVWGEALSARKFLHVSTDEVYGSLGPTGYFTENTPYAPNSPYAATKAGSDMLVRAYHHTHGLPTIITNCSNNYGPHQFLEKLIPVVIQSTLNREPIPVYGDGMNVRDWLFVADHCDALWLLLNKGEAGESYNVGGGNEWHNIHIVQEICEMVDELAPERGGNSRRLISFVKDRPGHDRRYAMDCSKIRERLGWTPATDFKAGLRRTVEWYLKNQAWMREVSQFSRPVSFQRGAS